MNKFDIIVVGAGAAGLLAAGRAAEKGAKVLLLEKMKYPGRKLLITGKGRCNITNQDRISEFIKHIYPNGNFLKKAFSKFFSKEIIALLYKYNVETNVERGGRVFPATNKAADVLQALLNWVESTKNVELRCGIKLKNILCKENKIFALEVESFKTKKIEIISAKKVLLCVGGKSYPATGSSGDCYQMLKSLGHKIESIRPALVPIVTKGSLAQKLQGLSLKNVKAIVWSNGKKIKEQFGEMLFTHFGLSGPIILSLSKVVVDNLRQNKMVEIAIDLKPALNEKTLDNRLLRELDSNGKKKIENICKELIPTKLIPIFLNLTGINTNKLGHQINAQERKKIRILLKDLRFEVETNRPFNEAIITAGGVSLNEINAATMQSKLIEGLFFAGELIDLDADTGGYNLQIAFSTGWLSGDSAFEEKRDS